MHLYEYIQAGGWIMYLLLLLNIVGFAIMAAKFLSLNRQKKDSSSIADRLGKEVKRQIKNTEPYAIIEMAKQQLSSHISSVEKGLNTVKIIASIAPLLGLLGTVIGVLVSFQIMSQKGLNDPNFFARGISMALITTVGGMIVAIPHFIGHNYLIGMLDNLESDLEREILKRVL